jgi:mRNA-degrading endonuclease RelE of RelBE toxin-antitoxin system
MNKLPPKVFAAVIYFCEGDLSVNPRKVGKPLKGDKSGAYSARRGPFRIIYEIEDEIVLVRVIRVGHRAHVYRNFVFA